MRTGIVVQARMGSSRLPGKVMMDLSGRPVLWHVVNRLRQCVRANAIIIATTRLEQDDRIETFAAEMGVACVRGSENDVLGRYALAASVHDLDWIVRVTSDCPLIDPHVIDEMLAIAHHGDEGFVSNVHLDASKRTFPRGLDAEVFSSKLLAWAHEAAAESYQREHVTPFLYEHVTRTHYYVNGENESQYRLTLDTPEDLLVLQRIYACLYHGKHDFYLNEIVAFLRQHPEIVILNQQIEQKSIK